MNYYMYINVNIYLSKGILFILKYIIKFRLSVKNET